MEANETRGVRAKKQANVPVRVMPYAPERGQMTYEQAVEHRRKLMLAEAAANEAKRRVMEGLSPEIKQAMEGRVKEEPKDELLKQKMDLEARIEVQRPRLAEAKSNLDANPTDSSAKRSFTRLANELDKLEDSLERVEAQIAKRK